MRYIQHSTNNDVLGAPPGMSIDECGALPITRALAEDGHHVMQSFWLPDAVELAALNAGHPVILQIRGVTHAPLLVAVAAQKT